jgi:mRNA interferase HigB
MFFLTTSPIVKYYQVVHIVTKAHLLEAMATYKDAAGEIKAWHAIARAARWHKFEELKATIKRVDSVNGYVIFDIRDNRYRLVTIMHYAKTTKKKRTMGHVYIRSFLTH